jgi:hypothetical protein
MSEEPPLVTHVGCVAVRGRPEDRLARQHATDLGGAEGTRTPDPLVANEVRYQLRYSP